jgi:hypothetical protein
MASVGRFGELWVSAEIKIPLEKVQADDSQAAKGLERIRKAFSRFRQSIDPRYVEIRLEQTLYRVKVDTLKETLKNYSGEDAPKSLSKKDLKKWLQQQFGSKQPVVQSEQITGHPKQSRKQKEQREVYADLGIMGQPLEQQKKSIQVLYDFLSEKGKKKLNMDKLQKLDISQLRKLGKVLEEEFSTYTSRGRLIYSAIHPGFSDEGETRQSIVESVKKYRQIVEENWGAFSDETRAPLWKRQDLLNGTGNEYEERFKNWWIARQPEIPEDPDLPAL